MSKKTRAQTRKKVNLASFLYQNKMIFGISLKPVLKFCDFIEQTIKRHNVSSN